MRRNDDRRGRVLSCRAASDRLSWRFLNVLDDDQKHALEVHLLGCPGCASEARAWDDIAWEIWSGPPPGFDR